MVKLTAKVAVWKLQIIQCKTILSRSSSCSGQIMETLKITFQTDCKIRWPPKGKESVTHAKHSLILCYFLWNLRHSVWEYWGHCFPFNTSSISVLWGTVVPPGVILNVLVGFLLEVKLLYKIGAFENNSTPNRSRFSISGTLRLHFFVRYFNEAFFSFPACLLCPARQRKWDNSKLLNDEIFGSQTV